MRYRTTFCGGFNPINGPFVQGAMAYVVWVAVSSSAAKIIWVNVWLSKASLIGICSRSHQLKDRNILITIMPETAEALKIWGCTQKDIVLPLLTKPLYEIGFFEAILQITIKAYLLLQFWENCYDVDLDTCDLTGFASKA